MLSVADENLSWSVNFRNMTITTYVNIIDIIINIIYLFN